MPTKKRFTVCACVSVGQIIKLCYLNLGLWPRSFYNPCRAKYYNGTSPQHHWLISRLYKFKREYFQFLIKKYCMCKVFFLYNVIWSLFYLFYFIYPWWKEWIPNEQCFPNLSSSTPSHTIYLIYWSCSTLINWSTNHQAFIDSIWITSSGSGMHQISGMAEDSWRNVWETLLQRECHTVSSFLD